MRRARRPLLLGLLAFAASGCAPRAEPADLPRGQITIQGKTVAVEIACTPAARTLGLSGRTTLALGTGLLFLHPEPGRHVYWMKDMNFAIDILWLREGRIVDAAHRVPPAPPGTPDEALPVYGPRSDADAVLEVPAGFARAHGFDVGAAVALEAPAGGLESACESH